MGGWKADRGRLPGNCSNWVASAGWRLGTNAIRMAVGRQATPCTGTAALSPSVESSARSRGGAANPGKGVLHAELA